MEVTHNKISHYGPIDRVVKPSSSYKAVRRLGSRSESAEPGLEVYSRAGDSKPGDSKPPGDSKQMDSNPMEQEKIPSGGASPVHVRAVVGGGGGVSTMSLEVDAGRAGVPVDRGPFGKVCKMSRGVMDGLALGGEGGEESTESDSCFVDEDGEEDEGEEEEEGERRDSKWPKKGYSCIFDQTNEAHMARYRHVFEASWKLHQEQLKRRGGRGQPCEKDEVDGDDEEQEE